MKYKKLTLGATMVVLLVTGYASFQYWLNLRAQTAVAEVATSIAPLASLRYQSVSATFWSDMVHVKGLEVIPTNPALPPLTIADFGVKADVDDKSQLLKKLKLDLKGISIPQGALTRHALARQVLATLPDKNVDLDLFVNYNYSSHKNTLNLFFYTKMQQLGQLEVNMQAENIVPHLRTLDDLRLAPIKKLSVVYHDNSLMNRLWTVIAADNGMSKVDYQNRLLEDVAQTAANTHDEQMRASLDQMSAFIKHPNYIKIALNFAPAVSYPEMAAMSTEAAKDRMRMTITSKEV